MQIIDNTTPPAAPAGPPPRPYEVELLRYGPGAGVERPTKVYDQSAGYKPGELLSADEVAVWERLTWLEAELSAAKAQCARLSESLTTAGAADVATSEAPAEAEPGSKRQAAEEELLRAPGDNNCVIAERIGASDELVRQTRKALIAAGKLEPTATVSRRDGTAYPATITQPQDAPAAHPEPPGREP
jgi:hypothetical protein